MDQDSQKECKSLLICGLPESGKTTFLGALAYVLSSQEIKTELNFDGLVEDREYINALAETWLNCEPMERTKLVDSSVVELKLRNENEVFSLSIPDLSGETWKGLWSSRRGPLNVLELSERSDVILLCIHCDNYSKPTSITDFQRYSQALGEEILEAETENWDPDKHTSTQTMLVDLLQTLSKKPLGLVGRRLAIQLSAWDLVKELNETPLKVLESRFPLLHQYLESGFDYSEWRVFGLSAQGGDLKKPQEIDRLSALDNPSERVVLVDDKFESHDLTLPMKWLFSK